MSQLENDDDLTKKKETYKSYLIASAMSFGLIALAYILSFLLNKYHPLTQSSINYMGMFSLGCEGTALYGLRDVLSWSRKSPAEILNQQLNKFFVSIGLFFGALAYLLKPL